MTEGGVRKPQSFRADDSALVADEDEYVPATAAPAGDSGTPQPTQSTRFARGSHGLHTGLHTGLRWGKVLISALAGAALLGAAAAYLRLVSAALVREDWIGWMTLALLATAAMAAVMIAVREVIGLFRLARLGRLRAEAQRALRQGDRRRERQAAMSLARLYAARPELSWSVSRFREHAHDVHDPGELLSLAERQLLVPLDQSARRLVTASAKRVATVTALSPILLVAVAYVAIENLRLMRALAGVYGGRPGIAGVVRLANMVLGHLVATGGMALTDDLLGQFLGQDVLRRLSRRLGEGAFNGALTARVGIAALMIVRPLPHRATVPPRARDILAEVLRPMAGRPAP
jgi:putative membrane protein